jgi:hypothetical protein
VGLVCPNIPDDQKHTTKIAVNTLPLTLFIAKPFHDPIPQTRSPLTVADQAYSNRIFPDVAKAMMAEAKPFSNDRRTPRCPNRTASARAAQFEPLVAWM